MGVERLSALSNQERSNLLSAGTKPGGCKFYSRREKLQFAAITLPTTIPARKCSVDGVCLTNHSLCAYYYNFLSTCRKISVPPVGLE